MYVNVCFSTSMRFLSFYPGSFSSVCLFCPFQFVFVLYSLDAHFTVRNRKGMALDGMGNSEELRLVGEEKSQSEYIV